MSFDLNNLQGMMAGLQQRMMQAKQEAEATEVTGKSGGGLVQVTATGGQEIRKVSIDPGAMDDREMLEDLIHAATNDALRQAKEVVAAKMSEATGGLPLPPGLM
ncbi:MAG: YbaB/EbfC family nucleoid-associated protein [Myxococcota bacterium]|nr:YbaB/EbfC family nucleoid-associated protein [Myxococcota bacterium]